MKPSQLIRTLDVLTTLPDEAPQFVVINVWYESGPWTVTNLQGHGRGTDALRLVTPIADEAYAVTYTPKGAKCCSGRDVATLIPICDALAALVPGELPPDFVAVLTAELEDRGAFFAIRPPKPGRPRDAGYWFGKLAGGWQAQSRKVRR